MNIISNHQYRPIILGYELPEKEIPEFDFLSKEELEESSFFQYRGSYYYLGDFLRIANTEEMEGWDGYSSDSYFSGTLVKLSSDGETVKVGRYYS